MNPVGRVTGERFDADQIQWACDECGLDEWCCDCEPNICAVCDRTFDSHGYCLCKADNGLSMEEVEARIARFVNPETSLVDVERGTDPDTGRDRIAA
jgi:hypothetical protein